MIRYDLKCTQGHSFDSWFQSAAAFDLLRESGRLNCMVCGSADVSKSLMAPQVTTQAAAINTVSDTVEYKQENALAEMRRQVEQNADYVGPKFASEARAMYLGNSPERAIYGEASGAEAKALVDDGIPVAPLPFVPSRKAN